VSEAARIDVLVDGIPPSSGALGRTEDIALTTDGRWLLAAGYAYDSIWAFEMLRTAEALHLGAPLRLTSPKLAGPHGVVGVDRVAAGSLIVVANRAGTLSFHVLTDEGAMLDLDVAEPDVDMPTPARSPSVLCVGPRRRGVVELYSCSNDIPVLRRTTLRIDNEGLRIEDDQAIELPLVAVPDGLAVSDDGRWLALSNHRYHRVCLYSLERPIGAGRTPDGIVSGIAYPHGLRFVPGRPILLAADAGAPYVHVVDGSGGWCGMHRVARSVRVMDDATFREYRYNPMEGGAKGLDITADGAMFLITSQAQPLAAFAVPSEVPTDNAEVTTWAADRERAEFEEWFATGVTNAWLENELRMLREFVAAWNDTKLVRWTRPLRALYARVRQRLQR